jgi:hypothetical protein
MALKCLATQATKGVFPVPPSVRLPMETTGIAALATGNTPAS